MTGGSLSRALGELEKLALFVGDAEGIREGDVQAVTVPSREWNVFRMADAIVAGDVPEALRQLRTLIRRQQTGRGGVSERPAAALSLSAALMARSGVRGGALWAGQRAAEVNRRSRKNRIWRRSRRTVRTP